MALPHTFAIEDDAAAEEERAQMRELAQFFARQDTAAPKIVFGEGQEAQLPELAYRLLKDAVQTLAQGDAVSLLPLQQELTPRQAADILGLSRQYLVRLLDGGAIPYHRVGSHRRIVYADLVAYQRERKRRQREALRDITRMSEELGLYDG